MDKRQIILAILRKISNSNVNPEPGESLFSAGLIDSFALVEVVSELEKAFSLKVPDADLNPRKFDTIERIETYLEQHGA